MASRSNPPPEYIPRLNSSAALHNPDSVKYYLVDSINPLDEIPMKVINMQRTLTGNVFLDEVNASARLIMRGEMPPVRPNKPYFEDGINRQHYLYLIDNVYFNSKQIMNIEIVHIIEIPISGDQNLYTYNFNVLNEGINTYIDIILSRTRRGGKRMKKRKSIKRKSIKRKSIKRKSIKRKTKKRRYTK